MVCPELSGFSFAVLRKMFEFKQHDQPRRTEKVAIFALDLIQFTAHGAPVDTTSERIGTSGRCSRGISQTPAPNSSLRRSQTDWLAIEWDTPVSSPPFHLQIHTRQV